MALIQTNSSLPLLNFNILTEVVLAEHNVLLSMRATCTVALDLLTPLAFCALRIPCTPDGFHRLHDLGKYGKRQIRDLVLDIKIVQSQEDQAEAINVAQGKYVFLFRLWFINSLFSSYPYAKIVRWARNVLPQLPQAFPNARSRIMEFPEHRDVSISDLDEEYFQQLLCYQDDFVSYDYMKTLELYHVDTGPPILKFDWGPLPSLTFVQRKKEAKEEADSKSDRTISEILQKLSTEYLTSLHLGAPYPMTRMKIRMHTHFPKLVELGLERFQLDAGPAQHAEVNLAEFVAAHKETLKCLKFVDCGIGSVESGLSTEERLKAWSLDLGITAEVQFG